MILTGPKLLDLWRRLSPLPGGRWLCSRLFGFAVPYSGSVGPRIRVLQPGHAVVEIPGRRSNRNHLGSVHAIALMNLAEITSGLAMMTGLPPTVRGIVTTLSMTYHKKARGTIRAVAHVAVPTVSEDCDFDVMAECFDGEGTLVATGHVRWRLGPVRPTVLNDGNGVHAAHRRASSAHLRADVSLLEPGARRSSQRSRRARRGAADLADLRARPRVPRRAALHPLADGETDRFQRAHRGEQQSLSRPDATLDRRRARGGGALLHHVAREPEVGLRARARARAAWSTTTSPSESGRRKASMAESTA